MNPQDLIRKKRDGETLSPAEIDTFIQGVTDGSWADYQTSALLMAMFVNGLTSDEQNALTNAMLHSGEVLDFSDINVPKADKHSTGGVGDKTSLIIAPLAAACGVAVPMISGRALGHTGGTLDKLESIPNYNVNLSKKEFHKIVRKCGFALAGQTKKIVPADRKLYALRNATATVESIPLIVASIMSKKLAEGLDALVLDVKMGNGAFIQSKEDSEKLARALCKTGNAFGVATQAVISDMNEPLGKYVGNALEVFECVKILRDEADGKMSSTLALSVDLAARMLILTGVADSIKNAKLRIKNVLQSGAALEKFRQNIELQNGDPKICDEPDLLLDSSLQKIQIKAEKTGFLTEVNTRTIGESISAVGGGRNKVDDAIDYALGFQCEKKIGDEVKKGETLGVLFCRSRKQADSICEKLQNAYKINQKNVLNLRLIKKVVA